MGKERAGRRKERNSCANECGAMRLQPNKRDIRTVVSTRLQRMDKEEESVKGEVGRLKGYTRP